MRKLITILALWTCLFCKSQVTPVSIVSITPPILCPDEAITVCFTLDNVISSEVSFEVYVFLNGIQYTLYSGMEENLPSIDTLLTGENIYCLTMVFPYYLSPGQWCVWGNSNPNDVYCIQVEDCTGIKRQQRSISALIYYDINGNITDRKPNQLLAEYRNGVFVRKVVFWE